MTGYGIPHTDMLDILHIAHGFRRNDRDHEVAVLVYPTPDGFQYGNHVLPGLIPVIVLSR